MSNNECRMEKDLTVPSIFVTHVTHKPDNGTRMTRKRRIYTDFLVLVPLTQSNEKTVGERDQHQIREDPPFPCHPCAIAKT